MSAHRLRLASLAVLVAALAPQQASSQPQGALFIGNIADACVTSAMSAGLLSASRDRGIAQTEAQSQVEAQLDKDPNREFYRALVSQNAEFVFGSPLVLKASQEQVALARCARFAKGKTVLTPEQVQALSPELLRCQGSEKPANERAKCVFSAIYEAAP